jgi:hypothetical protein
MLENKEKEIKNVSKDLSKVSDCLANKDLIIASLQEKYETSSHRI